MVNPDRDASTAGAGQQLHVIGYLLDYPQAVAGLAGQRVNGSLVMGALRLGSHDAIVVSSLSGGCEQIELTVVNLAIQRACQVPYPQPSGSAAMADSICRQLMHGQNHVVSPVFRKPGVTDAGSHAGPRCMQRARIELLIKDR
jgi:hypothetical protein